MQKILDDLNKVAGVKGSMLVAEDGMVIASALGPALDKENVAAISSHMILSTKRSMEAMALEKFSRFVLTSTHGKMIFVELPQPFTAYLVVITPHLITLDTILIEIDSTILKIQHRRA